jgi:hypothetical protein
MCATAALLAAYVSAAAAENVPPELAVAYLNASQTLERVPHPYPMFYHHHVAPHAVFSDGRIFFAYQDENGRPLALSYDVAGDSWDGPHVISSRGLGRDTHGNPSLTIDGAGRLHVFFGAHGGPLLHAVSPHPVAIDQWEEAAPPTPKATYPQSQRMADGDILLLYRAGGHTDPWVLARSADGHSWSEPENVIDLRRDPADAKAAAYCVCFPGADGQTLHLFFVHKDDNAARVDPHPWRPLKYPGLTESVYRYNMYYMRRGADGRWANAAGEAVETPISKRLADDKLLVYDSGDEFTFLTAIGVDGENRPWVRFNAGVVDWARGDRVIVPWRTNFAAPSPGGETPWKITTRLADAPSSVQPWLVPEVVPVYDADRGAVSTEWFLRHETGVFADGRGSHLFLGHVERGWIERDGGPAPPPSSELRAP